MSARQHPAADPTGPKRIQLRRTKGWRMPAGAVIVDRRTPYGNPWRMTDAAPFEDPRPTTKAQRERRRRQWAVDQFRRELHELGFIPDSPTDETVTIADIRERLRGKNLACWCPLDQPCHADELLQVANS